MRNSVVNDGGVSDAEPDDDDELDGCDEDFDGDDVTPDDDLPKAPPDEPEDDDGAERSRDS